MPHRGALAFLARTFSAAVLVGALGVVPAHARGVCYGDCSGNGAAVLVVAPLIFIYLKFWNTRKGAPSFAKCLGYSVVSALVALVVGFAAFTLLKVPLWAGWIFMVSSLLATFAFLVHPRRNVGKK